MPKFELAIIDPEHEPLGTLVVTAENSEIARRKAERELPNYATVANIRLYKPDEPKTETVKPW